MASLAPGELFRKDEFQDGLDDLGAAVVHEGEVGRHPDGGGGVPDLPEEELGLHRREHHLDGRGILLQQTLELPVPGPRGCVIVFGL